MAKVDPESYRLVLTAARQMRPSERLLNCVGSFRSLWETLNYRYVYERPKPFYRLKMREVLSNSIFSQHATTLLKQGVVILPRYFGGPLLASMKSDFERWCMSRPADHNGYVDFDGAKREGYLTSSLGLSAAAIDPFITALASYHWGKPIYLAYVRGYRTYPIPPKRYRAFQWHHDLKRKQVKAMVLLTDVPHDGQRMDYIPGSHKIWHRFKSQSETVFTDEEAQAYGEWVPCAGPAGTVIVFDTNGIHRGNRNLGPVRDQYTFNYTAGRSVFATPLLHSSVFDCSRASHIPEIRCGVDDILTAQLRAVHCIKQFWMKRHASRH